MKNEQLLGILFISNVKKDKNKRIKRPLSKQSKRKI